MLWLDEIQEAIFQANQDTEEALQCKKGLSIVSSLRHYDRRRCFLDLTWSRSGSLPGNPSH